MDTDIPVSNRLIELGLGGEFRALTQVKARAPLARFTGSKPIRDCWSAPYAM
jgi:hypothetical protein